MIHPMVPKRELALDDMLVVGVLAFVIGVFTQILWEDKTVTDPL